MTCKEVRIGILLALPVRSLGCLCSRISLIIYYLSRKLVVSQVLPLGAMRLQELYMS